MPFCIIFFLSAESHFYGSQPNMRWLTTIFVECVLGIQKKRGKYSLLILNRNLHDHNKAIFVLMLELFLIVVVTTAMDMHVTFTMGGVCNTRKANVKKTFFLRHKSIRPYGKFMFFHMCFCKIRKVLKFIGFSCIFMNSSENCTLLKITIVEVVFRWAQ